MNDVHYATAVHESGHAVISHVLGRGLIHVALLDDQGGEVVPKCSLCDACVEYYQKHSIENHEHTRRIQKDLRCDSAVAVAGEIAERLICGQTNIDPEEIARDLELSKSRASLQHLWTESDCWVLGKWKVDGECSTCMDYLNKLKLVVKQITDEQEIRSAIEALAHQLSERKRLYEPEVLEFLSGRAVESGSKRNQFLSRLN